MVCKQEAVSICIDDPTYIDACVERIGAKVNLGS